MVTTPGWINFEGGARDPALCTETVSSDPDDPGTILTMSCAATVENPDCLLDCTNEVTLEASGGQPPYIWTSPDAVTITPPDGDTVTVARTGSGAATPGVEPAETACATMRLIYTYWSSIPCATGLIANIGCSLTGVNLLNCDGDSPGGTLDLTTKGTIAWHLTGGDACDIGAGVQPLDITGNTAIFGNSGTPPTGTGFSGPADMSAVSLQVQFTPFGGGTAFDETMILSETGFGINATIDFPNLDVRSADMIAAGCAGCECSDDDPVTITVTDSMDAQADIILAAT